MPVRTLRFAFAIATLAALAACTKPSADDEDPTDDSAVDDTDTPTLEPVADAGPDQESRIGVVARLDGSASYDPRGGPIRTYLWELLSAPEPSVAQIANPVLEITEFTPDMAGEFVFSLVVGGADGVWGSVADTTTITVAGLPGFQVTLTWDNRVDLDLHIVKGEAPMWDANGDVSFCNRAPDWGVEGDPADDPSLSEDAVTSGFGPETFDYRAPVDDTYTVLVHYYSSGGEPQVVSSQATVTVQIEGGAGAVESGTMLSRGGVWTVGRVRIPDATWERIDQFGTTNGSCDSGW